MEEDNFDFVELLERNSITRLTNNYKNKLINKIKNNFQTNEQKLFLTSFYCYLNYNSKKDFIIDFSSIWKWTGFSRKDPAKRLLEKYFVNDVDYKIIKDNSSVEDDLEPTHGGNNKESIMLNINTFKKFCLKASTKKADEIHDYYIKLEEILQETINEETNELRLQLENKDLELETLTFEKTKLETKNLELEKNINKLVKSKKKRRS